MRSSTIALALTFSCAGLLVAIAPACSSSSSTPVTQDSGPGKEGGTQKDAAKDSKGGSDVVITETGPSDATGCSNPSDAGALLSKTMNATSACPTCLGTSGKCGSNLIEACGCEPACYAGLACFDECQADGGSTTNCAITCIGGIDGSTASATGASILMCAGESTGACYSVCAGATADAGDASDGS
jgi:hypothetical protein